MKNAAEFMYYTIEAGKAKAEKPAKDIFFAGVLAGIFIAIGTIAYIVLSGSANEVEKASALFSGGVLYSLGLMLVLLLGGSLFTGNCLMSLALFNKQTTFLRVLKNWTIVWFGNLVGSLTMVLIVRGSNLFDKKSVTPFLLKWTDFKMDHNIVEALLLGVLCNIIVVLIVLLAYAVKDNVSKLIVCIIGIIVFVTSGSEHIVANMFIVPAGIAHGADYSMLDALLHNFIPVTIGNLLGGALFIPAIYHFLYKEKLNIKL